MGRPEKPVNTSGGIATQFARELRELRARAGNPTYREMARSAMFSSSVLSSAASGNRMPSLQVTLAFVAACGGDDEAWRRRWHAATSGYPPPPTGERKRRPALFHRRGAPPHPAQLPPRPRGFTGRTAELAWLRSARDTPVVISGPTGVGKSDLALHYAHAITAEMTDGQLYADFGGPRHGGGAPPAPGTADVLDGFLRALGVEDDQLAGPFDHRAGLYRTLLAERRLVVVLDNVRDEQQVRPLLAETTTSTTLLVSRKRLLGLRDVRRLALTPLPRGDSIAMITAALPHVAVTAGPDCDRLAELCGDLPLALDLAVRKIASRPRLTLRRVVEEWRLNANTVDWLSVGDLSLRTTLETAYRTLSPPARDLLEQLARTAPGTLDPWPAALDEPAEEIADAGLLIHAHPYLDGHGVPRLVREFVLGARPAHGHDLSALAGPVSA